MKKSELIKEIKKIQKEEQDYQALFQLMLKKNGKDIGSMSDEEKKKFFNNVDKIYKAKTEGKLKINEGFSEIFGNPFVIILLANVIPIFLKLVINGIDRLALGDLYQESIIEMLEKLKNNEKFIESVSKIIANSPKVDLTTADKISKIPEVQKLAREREAKGIKDFENPKNPLSGKTFRKSLIGRGTLAYYFGETFVKAWNNPSMKNPAIDAIKNKIK